MSEVFSTVIRAHNYRYTLGSGQAIVATANPHVWQDITVTPADERQCSWKAHSQQEPALVCKSCAISQST